MKEQLRGHELCIHAGLLLWQRGSGGVLAGLATGLLAASLVVAIFYWLQRRGLFGAVAKVLVHLTGGKAWAAGIEGTRKLDRAVADLYRRHRDLMALFGWRRGSWVMGAGEVWLALHLLKTPIALSDAFILESLGQVVRSAAFAVPGAVGVQEGGFILLGSLVGLGPQQALALSLAKRVREPLLGLPDLLAWSLAEGRSILPSRSRVA